MARSIDGGPPAVPAAVSWSVISVCVVALALVQLTSRTSGTDPGGATARAVLTFQARVLVAAGALSEGVVESRWPALESLATTPEMSRRIAVVLAGVGGEARGWT